MPAATETARRQAADRLDDAYAAFLDGERDGDAFVAAYDYREDGYDLAAKAWGLSEEGREAFIEAGIEEHPESARYLVSAAAAFRLIELEASAERIAA